MYYSREPSNSVSEWHISMFQYSEPEEGGFVEYKRLSMEMKNGLFLH